MKAKLVKDNGRVRFYRLSKHIKKGKCDLLGEFDIVKEEGKNMHWYSMKVKPFAEQYLGNPEGIEYVAISDAMTHIERLVFPAFPVPTVIDSRGYVFTAGISQENSLL